MTIDGLVLGLLDTSQAIGDPQAAAIYRGFTVSWSRYGYHDVIIEQKTVDEILAAASDGGYRFCLIQPYGHVIQERWTPDSWQSRDFFSALQACLDQHDVLVMGPLADGRDSWFGFAQGPLLVNLEKHRQLAAPRFDLAGDAPRELPRPVAVREHGRLAALLPSAEFDWQQPGLTGWSFIRASLRAGWPVVDFSQEVRGSSLNLEPTCPSRARTFARYLGEGIAVYRSETNPVDVSPDQCVLLDAVAAQTANSRRGVFLWNIESYTDIETPRDDFRAPVTALYSVAAGFKPNRILQTHGFDQHTRVVYFDYSPQALAVKKCLVEQWEGEDFQDFVKYLFEKFPHPDTFYQLWDNRTPLDVDWTDVVRMCEREVQRWGGARKLRAHWSAYRKLPHSYVCCNLLEDLSPLLREVVPEPSAIIWWSNAFFTVYGNWFYSLDQRQQTYEHWIEQIALANPQLYLFGSDYSNSSVNFIQAADYLDQYRRCGGSYLTPCQANTMRIRM